MSFLKNILKPFVEFEPEKADQDSSKEAESQPKVESKPAAVIDASSLNTTHSTVDTLPSFNSSSATGQSPAVPTSESKKYFENLIEEANNKNPLFQGTDFKEFIDSKIDVESIADEGTRYKTAFNVLKRTGLTKERLITTGQGYIQLIDEDLKGFSNAYAQQFKVDVEQKEQLLQKKTEELKALNDKISALNNEIKQLSQQIVQNKEKLENKRNAFMSAGEEKKKEIQSELQKITQYFS